MAAVVTMAAQLAEAASISLVAVFMAEVDTDITEAATEATALMELTMEAMAAATTIVMTVRDASPATAT